MVDAAYKQELERWRALLDAEIRKPRALPSLVGLFWLQAGINTVGSSRDCTILLAKPAPRLLGAFQFDGKRVAFRPDIGQAVQLDGMPINGAATLKIDDDSAAGVLRSGELEMAATRLGERVGIRVWDSARGRNTPPRRWFPFSENYVITATYTPYPAPATIAFPDSTGSTQVGYAQGYISFRLEGRSYNLDATEVENASLFVLFRDLTNDGETYPEGRYLLTGPVSENGQVLIDFNRAFNPPSALSPFATCTFPPKANALACGIQAGEKYSVNPSPMA